MQTFSEFQKLHSVKDIIRWAASRFNEAKLDYGHGMSTAIDEAVYLTLHGLHLAIDTPATYWDAMVTDTEKEQLYALLKRRIDERIPAAYITQEGWFAGLPFFVDERVLVPRSPIAELVDTQFAPWVDPEEVESILDLCTGSGCIGIACAYAFPGAEVELADISQDALDVATINIQRHDAASQVTTVQSDGLKQLEGRSYDIIVSNPPYVDAEDMAALSDEFKHEPELGLSSGEDGLDLTRHILQTAAGHLNDNGILVVEVGNSQYALQSAFPHVPFHWLDFERGGDGVFLLTKEQLERFF
ncbi:MAG: 50S ribosomal protein L3 N(5)-glutamine methyltransferase [Proteobacteria bacterium]|nr:MAG: 50S ribosomal protein L3 N(5)-glutamine methyltransferase [Pseudomonadota bacterium]